MMLPKCILVWPFVCLFCLVSFLIVFLVDFFLPFNPLPLPLFEPFEFYHDEFITRAYPDKSRCRFQCAWRKTDRRYTSNQTVFNQITSALGYSCGQSTKELGGQTSGHQFFESQGSDAFFAADRDDCTEMHIPENCKGLGSSRCRGCVVGKHLESLAHLGLARPHDMHNFEVMPQQDFWKSVSKTRLRFKNVCLGPWFGQLNCFKKCQQNRRVGEVLGNLQKNRTCTCSQR